MNQQELESVARILVTQGKGILAADESFGTIRKRFDAIGVESTEETRRAYREMLFTAKGMEDFISGVILFDETLRQASSNDVPFPRLLSDKGVLPGIKVDTGAKPLAGFPGEKVTEGLDGLRNRLEEYRELGARFAKWRAVITIGDAVPSRACMEVNAHALARYAALCQEAGLVPVVEPESLMDGAHSLQRCEDATTEVLRTVFKHLAEQGVLAEGMLLKPNMAISGKDCADQAVAQEVAAATVRCFRRTVPAAVPGIVFLSGGQSPRQATENLNAMNVMGPQPWQLSFSYGRALQDPALKTWKGEEANRAKAQEAFLHRARCNGAARQGSYTLRMEKEDG